MTFLFWVCGISLLLNIVVFIMWITDLGPILQDLRDAVNMKREVYTLLRQDARDAMLARAMEKYVEDQRRGT